MIKEEDNELNKMNRMNQKKKEELKNDSKKKENWVREIQSKIYEMNNRKDVRNMI